MLWHDWPGIGAAVLYLLDKYVRYQSDVRRERLRRVRPKQLHAFSGVVQPAIERPQHPRCLVEFVLPAQLRRLSATHVKRLAGRQNEAGRECEYDRVVEYPRVAGICRVEEWHGHIGDIFQHDVLGQALGRRVHDFADDDRADQRSGVRSAIPDAERRQQRGILPGTNRRTE